MTPEFKRREVLLKGYCLGKGYTKALEAMTFASRLHIGLRKDGQTPEFQHQIEQGLHVTTLKNLIDEEACIVVTQLHDTQEDYGITTAEIERRFGQAIAHSNWLMTIKFDGYRKNNDQYYTQLAEDPIASICKGTDRIHNLNSMHGVFTLAKKRAYIEEVEQHFLPMLKTASDNFPSQYHAYMSLRQTLKAIVMHVRAGLPDETALN